MNEFLSLDWKPRVGVGGEEFQKRGVDEKGGANKIIIQMVRESSFFFPFNSEWSKAILFSLTQMQSIHFVRRPQGEGVSFWNASFTRLLSSGVPFMSGNTMASIFVSREIEISPSFFVCLWISRLFRYFFLLDRKLKEKKLESKVYQWGLRRFREE